MSLDLAAAGTSDSGNPRRQLRPLILVERARSLKLQKGDLKLQKGDLVDAQSLEFPSGTSSMAFPPAAGSPRKIIQNNPSALVKSGTGDGLPTPPQTPTLSADSHGHERGRSASVLQYHLPFRTIRLSSSPEPTPPEATKELLDARVNSEPLTPVVVKPRSISISFTEPAHPRDPISLSWSPPRPASRMSWCSTTSSSSSANTITASSPAKSSHSHSHRRRSQSYGSPRRVSCDTRGSSGTFGGEMVGSWNSANSVLDQDSVKEVEEELNDSLTPTPTIARSPSSSPSTDTKLAIPPFRAVRPPMKQIIPIANSNSGGRSTDKQLSSFTFPSSSRPQPGPHTQALFPPPSRSRIIDDLPTPTPLSTGISMSTRHRFLSLPTFMPPKGPSTPSRLGSPRKLSAPASSLALRATAGSRKLSAPSHAIGPHLPLAHSTATTSLVSKINATGNATRPRQQHNPTSPSLPSTMATQVPSTTPIPRRQHSVPLSLDALESDEILMRRESAATVDTFGAASAAGSGDAGANGRKSKFRKGVAGMFTRLFLERRASRGGMNVA